MEIPIINWIISANQRIRYTNSITIMSKSIIWHKNKNCSPWKIGVGIVKNDYLILKMYENEKQKFDWKIKKYRGGKYRRELSPPPVLQFNN